MSPPPQVVDLPISPSYDLEGAYGQNSKAIAEEQSSLATDYEKKPDPAPRYQDAFGDEENAEVKYKVLKWW